jgi:hypothetical protein
LKAEAQRKRTRSASASRKSSGLRRRLNARPKKRTEGVSRKKKNRHSEK